MNGIIRQLFGYAAASGCALAVDIGLLWALFRFAQWSYLPATTCAFIAGTFVSYVLSIRLAFREHRVHTRSLEILVFIAIGVVGLALNAVVMFIAVDQFGLNYLLAKGVAAGFTFTTNFFARRQFLFLQPNAA